MPGVEISSLKLYYNSADETIGISGSQNDHFYCRKDTVEHLSINQTEVLKDERLLAVLSDAIYHHAIARMCHMVGGKWVRNDVVLCELSESGIVIQTPIGSSVHFEKLQIHQPVGISFQLDQEKCIFDSVIIGFESAVTTRGGRILLEMPEFIEKTPRRSHDRQPVPPNLNVHVLFWHRGYADNTTHVPVESYWQGELINLSATGAQVSVGLSLAEYFGPNQLVGLQFTPMFYQKPILAEAQIIHLRREEAEGKLHLGLEFLGLEVSIDGRTVLHRLADIVEEYTKMNAGAGTEPQPVVS
jgi:hypothetical protein